MKSIDTRRIIIYIAVLALLIFLHSFQIIAPLENLVIRMISPLFSGFYSLSSNLRISYNVQTDKRNLWNVIKEMEARDLQLENENVKLKMLEEENQKLREHLNFKTSRNQRLILGNILSAGGLDNPGNLDQSIIIDKGSADGLAPGLAVVSSQGVIIGKVSEVKDNFSQVRLNTNDQCKLAATILNQDKTSGITEGDMGLTVKMKFIPQTMELKIGDIVVTSGLEENIPRGLIIGKISQTDKENNGLWQNATIEPLVNLDNLVIVSVLLP